jgi:hypothetical protein
VSRAHFSLALGRPGIFFYSIKFCDIETTFVAQYKIPRQTKLDPCVGSCLSVWIVSSTISNGRRRVFWRETFGKVAAETAIPNLLFFYLLNFVVGCGVGCSMNV